MTNLSRTRRGLKAHSRPTLAVAAMRYSARYWFGLARSGRVPARATMGRLGARMLRIAKREA
jgi:hypothetical protein